MHKLQVVVLMLCVLLGVGGLSAAPAIDSDVDNKTANDKSKALDYIAIVNGERVSMGAYVSALRRGLKDRFYHGKIPEEEGRKFRKEIADGLVDKALLVQEAKRRKLQPDAIAVDLSVKAFDAKYQDNPDWAKAREAILKQVREKLGDDSLAKVLEEKVHDVNAPSESQLQKFYDKNNDLFITPERVRVSLILLRVDPASGPDVWQQAAEEGASIVKRIASGADFAELARIHSSDQSAQNGGDMGFAHTGMLGENAQKVLDIMEPGEVSSPVVLLEGVSIFRLDDREKPRLNGFETVKERAKSLYMREKGVEEWGALLVRLRKVATIKMNDAPWRK